MKKLTGFIVTAGHLDIEWYQPLRSYRFWTVEAFEDLKIAAQREDFKTYVLDGQVFPLEEYLDVVPEDKKEICELIKNGKLTIGPFYTQFDEWLPSAESIIRNCLYGKQYCDKFGGYMSAGYLPDNFGHPFQLPQILQGFGIDSLMFMRGMSEIPGGHPDEFIYEGIDGSKVLVSHFRHGYGGAFSLFDRDIKPLQPRDVPYYDKYLSYEYHKELAFHDNPQKVAQDLIGNVHKFKERYPSGVIPLIAGFDHLPPQINIGDSVKIANNSQDEIEFVMGTAEDYIRAVQKNIENPKLYKMELIGSKYQYILLGALSTRSYLKRKNFACEAMLERYAEPLVALASTYDYKEKPSLLNEAWKYMMINSAHDSIHGSSTDEVHIEMESRYASVAQIASGITHDCLSYFGKHIKRWWEKDDLALISYSPVGANFRQVCDLWLPIGDKEVAIFNQDNQELPTQIVMREEPELNGIGMPRNDVFPAPIFKKVLFMNEFNAGQLNSFVVKETKSSFENIIASDTSLENNLIKVEICGSLINITNKETGKTFYGLNLLEEDADAGDAWDYSPSWISGEIVRSTSCQFTSKLIECGSVKASIKMQGTMLVPECLKGDIRVSKRVEMPVTFTITIYKDIQRVDVKLEFTNTAKDHRIRLQIPTGIKTKSILSQGHLAVLERNIAREVEEEEWLQPPTQLMPCREWVAAADSENGLAVALKGMYDYEAVTNPLTNQAEMYITLLRGFDLMGRRNTIQRKGGASDAIYTPQAQCLGLQEIEWSFIPYKVKEDKASFISVAHSFLYPPVSHAIRSKPQEELLEEIKGTFNWKENNIQFSAFKKSLDKNSYILRFFENQGIETSLNIPVNEFSKVVISNLKEDDLEELKILNSSVSIKVGKYKVVTLKLYK